MSVRGRRPRPWWTALCALLWLAPAHAALRLELDSQGLTALQAAASQRLVDDALACLPPRFKTQLDQHIPVRWSDVLPHPSYGRARRSVLLLNRRLLPGLADGRAASAGTGRNHRSERQELLATLLHELAHFHDRAQRVSDDPRLLDLAGWQVKAKRRSRQPHNRFVDRSPDPYELTSAREFVAVNMEYFLLDPAYACRRPGLHRYFSARFGWAPPPERCGTGYAYFNAGGEDGQERFDVLDPERVYQVDYLLAEGNDQLMSRWGHSMLRLVVCAPGRPRGPDCRLDLQHHRVLSFRAFVNDVQLSSWRGLTGSYPSRMFVLPLAQVVEEYTKIELRGLQSVPLKLERTEIAELLERAAQLHWSYDGQYYFIGNNCAVETFKLLHDGVPRLAQARLGSITPTGLMKVLRTHGLLDTAVLEDPREALRLGYRFDSLRERFQAMFAVAREQLDLPQAQVEDWLALPADARRPWFERTGLRASAALLLLEQAAQRRQLLLARDELKRRYLGQRGADARGGFGAADENLQRILRDSGYLSRPAELLAAGHGYGLPQPSEWPALAAESERRQAQLDTLGEQLDSEIGRLLDPALRADLDGIGDNVAMLGQRLRQLHGAERGMTLP